MRTGNRTRTLTRLKVLIKCELEKKELLLVERLIGKLERESKNTFKQVYYW